MRGLPAGQRRQNGSPVACAFASVSLDLSGAQLACLDARRKKGADPCFEMATADTKRRLSARSLLVHRPVALVALVPQPLVLFLAGASAGALGILLFLSPKEQA